MFILASLSQAHVVHWKSTSAMAGEGNMLIKN